jgi:phosphoglycerate dehydrogenase-like enzyme
MCIPLRFKHAQPEDGREAALHAIERAAAAVAVSSGPPTGWRLCRVVSAIELFEQGWLDLVIHEAKRAQLPRAEIPAREAGDVCALPFGAVLNLVRRLRDAPRQSRKVEWIFERVDVFVTA